MKYGCCITIVDYGNAEEVGFDYIELSGRIVCSFDNRDFVETAKKISNGKLP